MVLAQASGGGLVSGHARADSDGHPNILTELIKNCQRAVEREPHQPLVADAGELAVRDSRACFGRVGREPRAVERLDDLGGQQGLGMANVRTGVAIFPSPGSRRSDALLCSPRRGDKVASGTQVYLLLGPCCNLSSE
jgi:hypothetical protein